MRLSDYRVGQQRTRFWLEWDRGTMNARDLAVKFTSYAHARRLAGMGKRALDAASARLCRAGHRAREAHATCGSGQTIGNLWIGGVDNHRSAVEQTWLNRANLVAGYGATQSNGTARQFAQTMRVGHSGGTDMMPRCICYRP